MNLVQRLASLVLLASFGTAPGDRAPAPGRVTSGPAAVVRVPGASPVGFTTFGWVSPPASVTSEARVLEMAGAGLTLALPAWNDSGRVADNRSRLAWAAAHGMRCLTWDVRFERFLTLDPDSPAGGALLDSIVADYRALPGFVGYYLGDEPPSEEWPLLGRIAAQLLSRDPAHPAWNNLSGRVAFPSRAAWMDYLRGFLAARQPTILCDDDYDFVLGRDRGLFVENAAGLASLAREVGLPFWSIVQLVPHADYRPLTPGELAWQVSMLLAYGARGIGYFTYWTPAPDTVWNWGPAIITFEGQRTAWYPVVADLNRRVRPAGETLAGLTWLATEHAGWTPLGGTPFSPDGLLASVEGRAALGHFVDAAGTRHLLVANSDSLGWQRVTLGVHGLRRIWRLGDAAGDWQELAPVVAGEGEQVPLDLEPGGFALLRFGGDFRPVGAGPGPRLGVTPLPARGEARLAVSNLGSDGRVEILDAGGRRVRSWRPGAAAAILAWRGERDAGGWAPPGVYFVRAENGRGVASTRLEWLGGR
jgi:hypothetical protein